MQDGKITRAGASAIARKMMRDNSLMRYGLSLKFGNSANEEKCESRELE
jgi:hypothetical protein